MNVNMFCLQRLSGCCVTLREPQLPPLCSQQQELYFERNRKLYLSHPGWLRGVCRAVTCQPLRLCSSFFFFPPCVRVRWTETWRDTGNTQVRIHTLRTERSSVAAPVCGPQLLGWLHLNAKPRDSQTLQTQELKLFTKVVSHREENVSVI